MDKKNFCFKIYPLDQDLNKTWFVKYQDTTGKWRKKYGNLASFKTVASKLKEARRIIEDLENPLKVDILKRRDLITNLSKVLENRRPRIERKTYETYLSVLRGFAAWYRARYKINRRTDPAAYINYLFDQEFSNASVRKSLVLLKDFFNQLIRAGEYPHNPFSEIRIRKIKGKSKLPFHPVQVAQLKAVIMQRDPQLWEAIQFEYYLFFRPAEIRQLKISDLLFHDMKVILRDEVAKDDENYLKSIPEAMQADVLKYQSFPDHYYIFSRNGKPGPRMLSRDNLSKRHMEILRSLGYGSRYSFYSWVHTGIKCAAMAGIPVKQLQMQKGHSDLKMFDEYLKDLGVEDCVQLRTNFPAL